MRVTTHAVNNYIERVLRIEPRQVGDGVIEFAEEQIELAARSPEMVYENPFEKHECPVHVRNGCSAPVKGDYTVLPDGKVEDTRYVPTVYSGWTFIRKFATHEPARARG